TLLRGVQRADRPERPLLHALQALAPDRPRGRHVGRERRVARRGDRGGDVLERRRRRDRQARPEAGRRPRRRRRLHGVGQAHARRDVDAPRRRAARPRARRQGDAAGREGAEPVVGRRRGRHDDAGVPPAPRDGAALRGAAAEVGVIADLVFRGALVVDGSGREPHRGDVAIDGGRIVAVAPSLGRIDAGRTVDAASLALMPGIIDSHTHFDAQITWDPTLAPSPALGVTTAVIGNCGFTIAPCRAADRERTMQNLTQVEGMSLAALRAGIDWRFETFPEYLAQLRARGAAVNVAAYVGHSSVRTWVMGAEAATRAATELEIARMQDVVRDAMASGAVGFATSTS